MQSYQHWRLEADEDQILWLYFDKKNSTVNTIDRAVMEELSAIVDLLKEDQTHKGMIIASAKPSGFIAGADITQFNQFKDIDEATQLLREGDHILDRLEALKMPTVAMIEGFCLGGGLELSLACRYRVAEESGKTRLGLPEVKLGIHPGWGGTVRLPRLIGALYAMDLILKGRTVSSKAAGKMGFVDAVVPKRHLVQAAKYYVLNHPKSHQPTFLQKITDIKPVRMMLATYFRKKLREKINPSHYPAPFQVIDNWERIDVHTPEAMDKEAKSCGRLFFSDTCQNLVRVFFLQERLKALGKARSFDLKRVHVIGAGTMGGDIAAWCAFQGLEVTLEDREARFIAPAIKRAYALCKEKLKEPYLIQQVMDRLTPDIDGRGVEKADIIIEAIYEDLAAKQTLFQSLESRAKPQAILATNTSSIPLDEINTVLDRPERLVGIHFFNPVAKMLLVEVVKGERTDKLVMEKAISFVRKLDRLPLPVKSSPGFLVNRILMPYLVEGVTLLEEGIPATVIDRAMLNFGMPMGPITLADTVGLDICLSVAKNLGQHLHKPVPERLVEMVAAGKWGRKAGEGFYHYDKKGKQIKPKNVSYDKPLEEISDRLVLRMLDESFACLREEVVSDSDLLDAGMVFGAGFAPFRGGPIHYAKNQGIAELYALFIKLCESKGEKPNVLNMWEVSIEEG
jgi:3-hydroxyacyl-CoA dehydrogenase / enoyl-CoA hydratase / 3-hydroxybutyryl-CoA epimerase